MLSGSPPFGGATFDQLVSNVLALNKSAAFALIPDVPRHIVDGMLQVMPCDRSTIDELVRDPWVVQSGALPALDEAYPMQDLACGECDDGRGGGGGQLLGRVTALLGCGDGEEGQKALRKRLVLLFYGAVCVLALISFQVHGGFEGGTHFEMADP